MMICRNGRWVLTVFAMFYMILAVGANRSASAQEYGFDAWTTANGLPQNTITGVAQIPDGYLWLSTFDGLARFDGVRFTVFDKGNTKGIANNRFAGMFVDKDGTVWANTENNELTIYRNGSFTSFATPETLHEGIAIVSDANGNALIETQSGFYYLQDGKFVPALDKKEPNVSQIYYGRSGAKWVFGQSRVLRENDGQITSHSLDLDPQSLRMSSSLSPFEDDSGALWISIPGRSQVCRLRDGQVTVFTKKEIPLLESSIALLTLEDKEGSLWFFPRSDQAAATSQVVRFKDDQFTSYKLHDAIAATFGLTDNEGNIWLATTKGLRRFRQQLITSLSVKDGLNSNEVYPLLQANNGDIFIGTVRGVDRYSDGKLTDLGLKYETGLPLYMRSLWQDDEARVWVGFQGHSGFGRFEEPAAVEPIGKTELPNGVTDFASDNEGNIWIATEEGLFKYKDDKEIAHYTVKDGLRNDKIITLHFDHSGDLWLGTFDGLSQFRDGRFINFAEVENSPKGFVRVIYEDADGVLWFGTYGDGLVRYKDGRFFNYRVEHGLFNNGVFAIVEDDMGNFWMSSNRGIHRVSRQDLDDLAAGKISKLNSSSYDEKDGMPSAECNGGRLPAAIRAKDGKLWFATMGGVAIVDPKAERNNPAPPPVVIESSFIDRKAVDPTVLRAATRDPQSAIELGPGQSNIAFEYTGLSLIKSAQIKFRYKLEGLEENWVEAGTRRTVDYSYLPAGSYTFRVIAANANGVWNDAGAAVRIVVHPFFYQTWWFMALVALAIALVIWWFLYTRISRLRLIAETKTQFSRQLIESQEAERKRIASELHDGLGQSLVIIKNRAALGLNKGDDPGRVNKELNSISESASQALDEVREITNNLRPQLLDRLGLTRAIRAMLEKTAGVLAIDAEVDDIDGLVSENQEISIYRIIQESINNVIKHSNASNAVVTVKGAGGEIAIMVRDNGKGFDMAGVDAERGSLGLVGLKERAQLLNGELSLDSTPGRGTTIRVNIPVSTNT